MKMKKSVEKPRGVGTNRDDPWLYSCWARVFSHCCWVPGESLRPPSLSSPPPSHPLSFSGAGREGCPSAGWPSVSRMTILSDGPPLQVGMRQISYCIYMFTYFLLITIWPVDEKLNFHIRIFFRPKNIEIFQIFISYVYEQCTTLFRGF